MSTGKTDLSKFNNSWFKPGNPIKRLLWIIISTLFFRHPMALFSFWKRFLLRMFGARIGKGVIIKPSVNIKYPWKLHVGDHSWIGEKTWIDNLGKVSIGAHCCISQGAMLLCGNHNYKKDRFDLIVGDIILENGTWIGAQSVVCPGITCGEHSVLSVGSVATRNLDPYGIYQGIPATKVKDRVIES